MDRYHHSIILFRSTCTKRYVITHLFTEKKPVSNQDHWNTLTDDRISREMLSIAVSFHMNRDLIAAEECHKISYRYIFR
jgi:hypothetical protein